MAKSGKTDTHGITGTSYKPQVSPIYSSIDRQINPPISMTTQRVGIYIDFQNIVANGGYGIKYDILREFVCSDGAEAARLNVYLAYDEERAKRDISYRLRSNDFHNILRNFGYKVIRKLVKWYRDEEGNEISKANADLDMAIDAILQSEKLDRVVLLTGDGDFVQVVRALQNRGCRVEAIAFENVSRDLRNEVDFFLPGHLIPNLLPIKQTNCVWGELGSRVRGFCARFDQDEGFGFLRFISNPKGKLWVFDTRRDDGAFDGAYFHIKNVSDQIIIDDLLNRDQIFEFTLGHNKKGFAALEIEKL